MNAPPSAISADVLVYGGTVAGIAAAIAAARMGCSVVLVERGDHIGGMTASGLGSIDTTRPSAFGGIFVEFVDRVRRHYIETYGPQSEQYRLTYGGLFMEPKVASSILLKMVRETSGIDLRTRLELVGASLSGRKLEGATFRSRDTGAEVVVTAKTAIDGTYEGDLAAAAGVAFRVGR
jgi:flavin-dependent dehydrogenase